MARELLILRHAKSDWSTGASIDFERPLNQRGKHDAPQVGHWLREHDLIPDHILASPARRAKQTVLRVCPELGFDPHHIRWEASIYEAVPGTLLKLLADCPAGAQRVLLVGHNPGLDQLLLYLCPTAPLNPAGKLLTTAALARIALPDDWQTLDPDSGELLDLVRPREREG